MIAAYLHLAVAGGMRRHSLGYSSASAKPPATLLNKVLARESKWCWLKSSYL